MIDLKAFLAKTQHNLDILQEREARYGGNTPLDLLNQIEDHRAALALTRQALAGQVSQAEWRQELRPLLVAIDARSGDAASGLTMGDVTGGIHNSILAGGDVTVQYITQVVEKTGEQSPAELNDRRILLRLRQKVQNDWIDGKLERLASSPALIDIAKTPRADLIEHSWHKISEQPLVAISPDKTIGQIFEESNHTLLILGDPGSGKTTLLLQLAGSLLEQIDDQFRQPLPVIFNLSTWSQGQLPLIDWLAEEMRVRNGVKPALARRWLDEHRLLPLLDGLDEVKPERQPACVEAINRFALEFGLAGLVVCCRLKEYLDLPVRLHLDGAIYLQPLTSAQIDQYLCTLGPELEGLRQAVQQRPEIKDLTRSPLVLALLAQVYRGAPAQQVAAPAGRRELIRAYLEQMLGRLGPQTRLVADDLTRRWLGWLAGHLSRRNRTVFLLEQIQPDWLPAGAWRRRYLLYSRITTGLVVGAVYGVTSVAGPLVGLVSWIFYALLGGLGMAVFDSFYARFSRAGLGRYRWRQVVGYLLVGGYFALMTLPLEWFGPGPEFSLAAMVPALVINGLLGSLFFGPRSRYRWPQADIHPGLSLAWRWRPALKVGLIALLPAALMIRLVEKQPPPWLFFLTMVFLSMLAGVMGGLRSQAIEAQENRPNRGIFASLRNALFTAALFGLATGLFIFTISSLASGVEWGVLFGSVWAFVVGMIAFSLFGGREVARHYTLRLLLYLKGDFPLASIPFLDYIAGRVLPDLFKKSGNSYILHHTLLEYLSEVESGRRA